VLYNNIEIEGVEAFSGPENSTDDIRQGWLRSLSVVENTASQRERPPRSAYFEILCGNLSAHGQVTDDAFFSQQQSYENMFLRSKPFIEIPNNTTPIFGDNFRQSTYFFVQDKNTSRATN